MAREAKHVSHVPGEREDADGEVVWGWGELPRAFTVLDRVDRVDAHVHERSIFTLEWLNARFVSNTHILSVSTTKSSFVRPIHTRRR